MPRTYPHTPGPWLLEAGRTINTRSGSFYLSYERDAHNNPLFKSPRELDSIAHLVAAAPDLFAALETIAAQCGPFATTQPALDYASIGNIARAALLKATQE